MIEIKDIEKLAELSRINLNQEEKEKFRIEIDSILSYVNQIQKASGSSMPIENQIGPLKNILREDIGPHESGINTEDLLKEAPFREGNYLKVKKIL